MKEYLTPLRELLESGSMKNIFQAGLDIAYAVQEVSCDGKICLCDYPTTNDSILDELKVDLDENIEVEIHKGITLKEFSEFAKTHWIHENKWLPPEATDKYVGDISTKSDVFVLGEIIFYMLTDNHSVKRKPFISRVTGKELPGVYGIKGGEYVPYYIDGIVEDFFKKTLYYYPDKRCSISDAIEHLELILGIIKRHENDD